MVGLIKRFRKADQNQPVEYRFDDFLEYKPIRLVFNPELCTKLSIPCMIITPTKPKKYRLKKS